MEWVWRPAVTDNLMRVLTMLRVVHCLGNFAVPFRELVVQRGDRTVGPGGRHQDYRGNPPSTQKEINDLHGSVKEAIRSGKKNKTSGPRARPAPPKSRTPLLAGSWRTTFTNAAGAPRS